MKVVDLVTRNSDQLSLHFSDFFYEFISILQVHCFGKQKGKRSLFAQRPLEVVFSSRICPWPDFGAGEAAGGRNPAPAAAGGEGPVGERQEESERNLGVGSVGSGVTGAGGAAESSGRQWRRAAAATVRWSWATASGSGSTGGGQGSLLRGLLGTRKGGRVGSAGA